MSDIDLTEEQQTAFDAVTDWLDDRPHDSLSLGGYAGTGKTTVLSELAKEIEEDWTVAYCAFTGKAASVLRDKLSEQEISVPFCGTLHSLMYIPRTDKRGRVIGWMRRDELEFDLVIVDEASMVGKDLWRDLCSFGVPILCVGDHGQLPPVGGASINLMANPKLRLETIHRQAADNPIIQFATAVRQGANLDSFKPSDNRVWFGRSMFTLDHIVEDYAKQELYRDGAILCHMNRTRVRFNNLVRKCRGFEGDLPVPDDQIICLKNTDLRDFEGEGKIFNGMRGEVVEVEPFQNGEVQVRMTARFGDFEVAIPTNRLQYGREKTYSDPDEFGRDACMSIKHMNQGGVLVDFGYAMTVHKSQGSQYHTVIVAVEKSAYRHDFVRWLYTAATRATDRLAVVWL